MYSLIETYRTAYGDLATTINGRSYPCCCLIEDNEGLRWFICPDEDEVQVHAWTKAHAGGAVGLILADGTHYMTAETFMDSRTDAGAAFHIPKGLWLSFPEPPSYIELVTGSEVPVERRGGFVQLHVHSEYSALDGLSTIDELVAKVTADDNTALAITDHGTCAGHPALQRACDKAGIKPIFGMEAYFIDDRLYRPEPGDVEGAKRRRAYSHLILLAKDNQGLHNLWALSTEGWRDGKYYKPCIDWDSLKRYGEGLIATTACLGGPISQLLLDDQRDAARLKLGRMLDIFGENLFLEIQPSELEEQKRLNPLLVELGREMGIPLLAAVDGHYPDLPQKELHSTWLACQTGPSNEDYWHFDHTMTEAEVRERLAYLGPQAVDEAVGNTLVVADRCNARIEAERKTPIYSKKGGHAADVNRLFDICTDNWAKTEGKSNPAEVYFARFEKEMNLLIDKKFCGYFLLVWDYVREAKSRGILVGPGRGSGGGSLVAYLANITEIDPVETDLMFERFLTEGRTSLPDFDLDFPSSKRKELQNYLRDRYGDDHVMRVGTHLRYKSKGIIGKIIKVLSEELPKEAFEDGKKISKLIDAAEAGTAGLGLSWEELWIQQGEVLEPFRVKYPKVFDLAERLVGRLNSYGSHAAGMVVSTEEPLADRWPMRAGEEGDAMVSQFEFPDLELLWLIKLDLLTIRTLDTIQETLDLIEEARGHRIDVYAWQEEYHDPQVWQVIADGYTLGIFQIETASGTKLAKEMKPTRLQELADMGSIVRPGPARSGLTDSYLRRRSGQEQVSYPDPRLEEALGKTYGAMIYQEDIMRTCMVLAGYDGEAADGVRKILGKKKVEAVQAAGEKFLSGCVENGMNREAAERLWAQMAEFAKYGFNRAHAYAYAMVTYWCAWFKVHYPVEFLTSALSTVHKDRVFEFVAEARRMGVAVLPPDINASGVGFRPGVLEIRYGLDAIKGVGEKALADLIVGQPYASFEDFIERKGKAANAGVVLTLARVGAFDSLEPNRKALVERLEAKKDGSDAECVHMDLTLSIGERELPCGFDWELEPAPINKRTGKKLKPKPLPKKCFKGCRQYTALPPVDPATVEPYTDEEIRSIEVEMLGGHLSSTPFDAIPSDLREEYIETAEAAQTGPEAIYLLCGVLTKKRPHTDRSGNPMGFITIATETVEFDMVVFGDHWRLYSASFRVGSLVLAEVRKSTYKGKEGFSLLTFINV
jgi:DNA polymerase-3 subunit alpha